MNLFNVNKLSDISNKNNEWKIKLNDKNYQGNTLLHTHIVKNNFDIVEYFLENGAYPNVKNNYGQTPFHLLLNKDLTKLEIVKLIKSFVKYGASPFIRDPNNIMVFDNKVIQKIFLENKMKINKNCGN